MYVIYMYLWLVACGVWNYVSVYVVLFLCLSKCFCMYMCVWVSELFGVCVSLRFCMCEWLVSVCDTVKCCPPPPAGSASPASVLSGPHVLGWAVPAARNLWLVQLVDLASSTWAPGVSALLHAAAFAVCCCVGVPVYDVGMYVCAECYARCGVRRHNLGAFLKRLGSRHACKLTLNWLGTATGNSLSDDSPCGHLRVP